MVGRGDCTHVYYSSGRSFRFWPECQVGIVSFEVCSDGFAEMLLVESGGGDVACRALVVGALMHPR
jgi:hypothetical protein